MSRDIDVKALVSHLVRGDGADKCRICLGDTSEGQVYLGDTVMMDGERPVTLAELLEVITGVEMEEDTHLPLGACATCASSALAAQEFRTTTQNSQQMWYKAVNALRDIPKSASSGVRSLCAFVKHDNLSIHVVKDFSSGNAKTLMNRLKNRLKKKVKKDVTEKKPRMTRAGQACSCPDCGKSFYSPFYLCQHLSNSGQKEACAICGLVVPRGEGMKNHLLSVHGENIFTCEQCPQLFTSNWRLEKHVAKSHKPGSLTCADCGRTFPRKATFDAHAQMHAVRTCRTCGRQFTNRLCYREHRSKCEPDARPDTQFLSRNKRSNIRDPATFTCDYCGKTYLSRPQLKNHIIWIHMDVRPHQCQWCGKRFYTPARLAEHTVVHTRERNFGCDVCGMKLVSRMAAIYHKRRHTGEKPYTCEDCGEKFISSSRRTEHAKRRHGKGPLFQCDNCDSVFVRNAELKKHKEKSHRLEFVAKAVFPPEKRSALEAEKVAEVRGNTEDESERHIDRTEGAPLTLVEYKMETAW